MVWHGVFAWMSEFVGLLNDSIVISLYINIISQTNRTNIEMNKVLLRLCKGELIGQIVGMKTFIHLERGRGREFLLLIEDLG